MDNYFRPAGDLDDSRSESFSRNGTDYFHIAGDLDDTTMEKNSYFRVAGDLSKQMNINDYLFTITSGKKYSAVCELGVLMESGKMIIDLNQLKRMVDEGYNIVSANALNVSGDMIEVEFQRYVYDEELMERRRRF